MNLFKVASLVVLASKLDDLIKKYPTFESDIKELNKSVPQKYLEWSTKQLVSGSKLVDIIPTVKSFDKSPTKFKFSDINRYKTLKELEDEVKELSEKGALESKTQKLKSVSVNDAKKLYEDEQYVLIRPDTKAAVQKYGKGTKWCITMSGEDYYYQYASQGIIFYFLINKQNPSEKYAISIDRNIYNKTASYESYDAEDHYINEHNIPLWDKIYPLMESDMWSAPVSPYIQAGSRSTKPEVLDKLADTDDENIKTKIADNPNTSPETLDKLVKSISGEISDADDIIKLILSNTNTQSKTIDHIINSIDLNDERVNNVIIELILEHHNTSLESLTKIVESDNNVIKIMAAKSARLTKEMFLRLSKDDDDNIRWFIAGNTMTPSDILSELSKDPGLAIRMRVADNHRTPPEILSAMSDDDDAVLKSIATNRNTPVDILIKLSNNKNARVREYVAYNKKLPMSELKRMLNDSDSAVVNSVKFNIDHVRR